MGTIFLIPATVLEVGRCSNAFHEVHNLVKWNYNLWIETFKTKCDCVDNTFNKRNNCVPCCWFEWVSKTVIQFNKDSKWNFKSIEEKMLPYSVWSPGPWGKNALTIRSPSGFTAISGILSRSSRLQHKSRGHCWSVIYSLSYRRGAFCAEYWYNLAQFRHNARVKCYDGIKVVKLQIFNSNCH